MQTVEDRLNNALDAALEMTFPASDPIAVYIVESEAEAKDAPPRTHETDQRIPARTPQRSAPALIQACIALLALLRGTPRSSR
jgi:hypothetical protein